MQLSANQAQMGTGHRFVCRNEAGTNKLEDLAMGKDGRWSVQTDEAVLNGRKMAVLRLKGKTISLAHGEEIAFLRRRQPPDEIFTASNSPRQSCPC